MTRPARLLFLATLALAACGADGPPLPPSDPAPAPQGAISVTGEARFGVTAAN